eukprot:TRINITY_DN25956_c1_g2_i1.p1 TRINITY_DN25956_c1_g2~~TRINITY_DN25956_c1_g2_i1.p1  ORF type:complete len:846 (-),score=66.12 TRINITY_DN25956_c1_g2_i1:845-3355(-)
MSGPFFMKGQVPTPVIPGAPPLRDGGHPPPHNNGLHPYRPQQQQHQHHHHHHHHQQPNQLNAGQNLFGFPQRQQQPLPFSLASLSLPMPNSTHPEVPAHAGGQRITVLYATQGGTALCSAINLASLVVESGLNCRLLPLEGKTAYTLLQEPNDPVVFIVSCYHGSLPASARPFMDWLYHTATRRDDPRSQVRSLAHIRYAIFGLGSKAYTAQYNKAAIDLHACMQLLSATPLLRVGLADPSDPNFTLLWQTWVADLVDAIVGPQTGPRALNPGANPFLEAHAPHTESQWYMTPLAPTPSPAAAIAAAVAATATVNASLITSLLSLQQQAQQLQAQHMQPRQHIVPQDFPTPAFPSPPNPAPWGGRAPRGPVTVTVGEPTRAPNQPRTPITIPHNAPLLSTPVDPPACTLFRTPSDEDDMPAIPLPDLEDIGLHLPQQVMGGGNGSGNEFFTPELRTALAVQGYKLVGSHAAIRLGRWTKASLRGRGACFKRTFYGVVSYQTMEMSPSLSCANRCVFCWRHPDTPVSGEWKWASDDPRFVAEGCITAHVALVNSMRDVHGVKPERLSAAQTVRYCDFSLVGEPILYPLINQLIDHMHQRQIATFLYTNGQFPEKLEALRTVAQLVISVDSATPEDMEKITRPLFPDAWGRFIKSLEVFAARTDRKVLRLTVIKGWNDEGLDKYASLVSIGHPDFIEVKGVIYCGKTEGNQLSLDTNIPQHDELVAFAKALCSKLNNEYDVACEHEHSSCVLVAHKRFKIDGAWHTWLDVNRYLYLLTTGRPFTAVDYCCRTPAWALLDSEAHGMDPSEVRHRRRRKRVGGDCGAGACCDNAEDEQQD